MLPGVASAGRWYGNDPLTVNGASGSFTERKSANTRRASAAPKRFPSASRNIELRTSCPPFVPKREPMSAVKAMTSRTVNDAAETPFARYQRVIPAAYAWRTARIRRALRPERAERVDLIGEERLRVRTRHEVLSRERECERVDPGDVERRDAGGPTELLEEQSAIRRGHPAGSEGDVRFGPPRDMCDTEAVADDRDPGARLLAQPSAVAPEPERRRLEVPPDVGCRDRAREGREPVVERRLIPRVAADRGAAALARREDRPGRGGGVVRGRGRSGGRHKKGERRDHHHRDHHLTTHAAERTGANSA